MFQYSRPITDEEEQILLSGILDIQKWIDEAIQGKIESCLAQAAARFRAQLSSEGETTAPILDADIFSQMVKRPDYKSRAVLDMATQKIDPTVTVS